MLLDVRHCKDVVFDSWRGSFVPVGLDESAANAVNFSEGVQIRDDNFSWFDPDHRTVLLVKLMHIEDALPGQDLVLRHSAGESGMPWPWHC